ncbi:hypothetical protein [Ralstonia pseudosolanacearum]|uniref:hypothetical protein n=1 Tax=Ralstonia pseudosolanacearum TaxID=1310165 RepID=UPI001FF93EA0|nr:hypothetical protein [Ralstonia pseudosolanacearum]
MGGTEMNALNRFEVLAVNDDRDFCECCGRRGLKRVVWVRDRETDDVKHFGTTCVLAPSKAFGIEADIKVAIARFESREKAVNHMAYREYKLRGGTYVAHPEKSGTWVPADQTMYSSVRAEINARSHLN